MADATATPYSLVTTVLTVSDIDAATAWTSRWLGEPTLIPMPGIAEWKLTDNCWLQLMYDADRPAHQVGGGILRLGVEDLDAEAARIETSGITVGPRIDIGGFLAMRDFTDPDHNTYSLIMEL